LTDTLSPIAAVPVGLSDLFDRDLLREFSECVKQRRIVETDLGSKSEF
jgi:hypothetical protein